MTEIISSIVHELSDKVFHLINRIVRDREHAMDLTQDVFVKILREPDRIRDRDKLKPYVFRAAYNIALNFKRDNSRRQAKVEIFKDDLRPANPAQPDQLVESAEISAYLNDALDLLAPKQKKAIALRFFAELTITEIAVAMEISDGTVKVHIARGLQNLRKRFYSESEKEI